MSQFFSNPEINAILAITIRCAFSTLEKLDGSGSFIRNDVDSVLPSIRVTSEYRFSSWWVLGPTQLLWSPQLVVRQLQITLLRCRIMSINHTTAL